MADDKLTQEQIDRRDELNEKIKEGIELTEKEKQELRELLGIEEEIVKVRDKKLQKLYEEQAALKAAIDLENQRADSAREGYANAERQRVLEQSILETSKMELENLRERVIAGGSLTEEEMKRHGITEDTLKELDKQLNAVEALEDAYKEINGSLGKATELEAKMGKLLAKGVVAINSQQKGRLALNAISAKTDAFLITTFKTMLETATEADKVFSEFRRTMQLGDDYETRISDTTRSLAAYGVTVTKAAEAQNALIKTTTDFTMLNNTQKDALVTSAAVMERLGVANQDFAQGVQNSMKFYNQGTTQAIQTQGELAATARALGQDQGEFAAKFAKSGHQLAKFGQQGVKAFKDLQHIAKITGMEMEKILGITNKFDTFEGAAEQAGKLNAALGGNMVNAMDLMMATDPAERFGMIRDSILDAGLSFDDMSYYQKNFYKDALGLSDVGDLALMLSGDMDSLAGATTESAESLIEQKKRAAEAASLAETYKNILVDLGTIILPIVQGISKLTKQMVEYKEIVMGFLIVGAAYKAYTTIMQTKLLFHQFAQMKLNKENAKAALINSKKAASELADSAAKDKDTASGVLNLGVEKKLNQEGQKSIVTNKAKGKAKAGMIPTLLAFGAAIMMVGAGVYFAATGMANLADSVANLNPSQLDAFSDSLIYLGIALGTVMAIIVLIGVLATGPQVLGIMGVAAAFMMMGVGVALAAAGMGLMAEGFAKMFQHIDLEKVAATAVLFGVLYLGAGLGYAAALGIAAIGLALGGLTLALKFMNFKKLDQITGFMTAFTDFEISSIYAVTLALEDMAKTIDEMDMKKTIALEAVLATTAVVGATMGPALMLPMMVAGAVGGGVTAAMQATAAQPAAGGGGTTTTRTPLVIKLGDTGDTLQKFIIETVGNEVKVVNS